MGTWCGNPVWQPSVATQCGNLVWELGMGTWYGKRRPVYTKYEIAHTTYPGFERQKDPGSIAQKVPAHIKKSLPHTHKK